MELLVSKYRTHTCGELKIDHVGQEVKLSGWVNRSRNHGGVVFIDLRDHYGITQVIFSAELGSKAQEIRLESVINITGKVVARGQDAANTKISTGAIEIVCSDFQILSSCEQLPFQIADDDNAPEPTRLKYRFLELRREKLHKNIVLRSQVIAAIRRIMVDLGFNEFQTPILTSSSPEGARDYIVPSRHHHGKFFALPQAPQQFKQLLMVAGFDRYFQIAPCFRDEDARADRSPGEFYQCDLEMSFVEQEDVFKTCEQLFYKLFTQFTKFHVTKAPFPRITYQTAISEYGIDKPDLRIPFKIQDVSSDFAATQFKVFADNLASQGSVRAIGVNVEQIPSRKYFDELIEDYKKQTGQGLAYLIFDAGTVKGSIAKFVSADESTALKNRFMLGEKAVVYLMAGKSADILPALGKLRVKLGNDLGAIKKDTYEFCWVTDFPMYEKDSETGQIVFSHNPFSMPQGGLDSLLNKDPLTILAHQYDIVCNGYELSSGAIRNHKPEIMYKAFEIAGYTKADVDNKFGGMIRAFTYGAPPHGGMAPGIDRIVMLLAQELAIREVIAFPLAQSVEDLMMSAPNEVTEKQLKELHISITPKPQ